MKRYFEKIRYHYIFHLPERLRKVQEGSQADDGGIVEGLLGLRGDVGGGIGDAWSNFLVTFFEDIDV